MKNIDVDPRSIDMIIYHGDCTDGMGAAWAAWKALGSQATYHPLRHGEPPPDVRGRRVAIVDFSFKRDIILQLVDQAEALVVIDHHHSAQQELQDLPNCHFDMSHSGAVLSWMFFHPRLEIPWFIKLIEDRDLWAWLLPHSKFFSAAFLHVEKSFESYDKFTDPSAVWKMIESGHVIMGYDTTTVEKISRSRLVMKWRDLTVVVVNSPHLRDELGSELAHEADFVAIWNYDGCRDHTVVSLRSHQRNNVDVSAIAKEIAGGGGHKQSSAFSLKGVVGVNSIFQRIS